MVGNEELTDRNALYDEVKKEDEQINEYDVPNTEFYDFFKDKKKECFEIDQMWAIYDEIDGMPRRYARIRGVFSPGFKVRMTWLEPASDDKGVKDWTEAELPVACGKFIRDRCDKSKDLEIFSHTVEWEKGDGYASYRIYPRKGETWAVFDNWDIKWSLEPEKHKDFQYKFVEVLSDYSEESGVLVSYLIKIEGFVSLFKTATCNGGNVSLQIPPNEILRFSHRAPSHRTTGREREVVPAGYFELDPASVPTCIEEIRDLDLNVPIECIDAKDGVPFIEDESHMANIRKTSGVSCTMQGENFKGGSGSPSFLNGCYEEKMSEENANHLLELTSSGSDSSNIKEIGLDPASLPTNFEETSNPVNLNLNSDIVDPDSPVSLGSLEEENPFFFKKRDNPDEKSFLDEGNSEIRYGSPRLLNGCLEENADHPFVITPCGPGHAKSCDVSDAEGMGPDRTILSSNVEESCVHADEKALGEINNSSKSPAAGGRLIKRKKKKKNPDVKGSPRLSKGCYKKKHCKETSAYAEKISSDSQQVENKLEIYPKKGEVWALCRSDTSKWPWSNSSTISDVDIVEVLEDNTEIIKVLVLKTVIASAKTVYKPKKRSGNDIVAEIPRAELLKFSHKIPVRRWTMTGLQECWELDMQENFPVEDSIADESKGREAANESESIVGPKDIPDQEFLEFVDSDFNDFDLDRKEDCFAVGQVWASYDRIDGMPRGYARIEKVYSPGFMVEITTLKADLEEADEVDWIHEDLPITCGKFKHDITLIVDDRDAFSHRVEWEIGMGTGSYRIYPRKGETWALFKNVDDIKRSSDPINTRNIRYEYVEILSDYCEELGINVAYLVKIKGFVSLFMRTLRNGMNFIQITPDEQMKFSHKVPSFRTTGKEREDVPEDYFELDPASLPSNLEVISEYEDVQVNTKNVEAITNDSSVSPKEDSPCERKKRKMNPLNKNSLDTGNSRYGSLLPITPKRWRNKKRSVLRRVGRSGSTFGNDNPLNLCRTVVNETGGDGVITNTDIVTMHRPVGLSEFVPCDIPHAENSNLKLELPSSFQLNPEGIPEGQLHNFRDDKTHEKFQPGQVWAVYCDLDGLPKYYVRVKTVEIFPDFKVEGNWLQSCAPPKGLIQCNDENMPLSCGMFETGETHTFDDTTYFSHHLTGVSNATENKFEIFPRKDEVWALYRKFSPSMSSSDLQKHEYEMVVVVEEQVHWMIVLVLQKFSSCMESVFMPKLKAGHLFHMAIPRCELLRFSHQVPAFRLNDDKYGSLRGSWVLDSESMPSCLLSSN